MVFRPYPQVIRCFFNNNRFGPPPRVTGGSACPGIDHPASGLPWRTKRALRTRLRFGSAIRLNLARHGNSQAHYAKGMRSPSRAPTVSGRMISGSFHSLQKGSFHLSLAVLVRYRSAERIQPCGMGSTDSDGVSRVPAYLGFPYGGGALRGRGSHPPRRGFPAASARAPPHPTAGPRYPMR